jgi:hypothetical protein
MRDEDPTIELDALLPAVYRLRDAEVGHPLRGLLAVVGDQVRIVRDDIAGLWDDFFVETCAEWVIPYIGDLVGSVPLHGAPAFGGLEGAGQHPRADVAKTISYRRRKGTLPMLEELTRDVTGWGAHAVAFFELLGWTQHLNHLRMDPAPDPERHGPAAFDRVGTANVRNADAMDRVHGPFDTSAHVADVRPIGRRDGWHGIGKVGLFVWRLGAYRLTGVTAKQADPPNGHGWHLSPLGNPAPLFTLPVPETEQTGLAGERNVPGPIRPLAFRADPAGWYGPDASIHLVKDRVEGDSVPAGVVVGCDLRDWRRPPAGKVAIDVQRGRCTFAAGEEPKGTLTATFTYGFSANLGGGPYDRRRPRSTAAPAAGPDTVAEPDALDLLLEVPSDFPTIQDALDHWSPATHPRAVIQLTDSRTYPGCTVAKAGTELVIQAARNRRPLLAGDVVVTAAGDRARLALDGLLVAGSVDLKGTRGELELRHCTLVPGRTLGEDGRPAEPAEPSLLVDPANTSLRVTVDHSITGPLRLPDDTAGLVVRDSIVDAPDPAVVAIAASDDGDQPGPATTLERVTVLGRVRVRELTLASDVLFTAPVVAERRQGGCVRFSFLPEDSETPRRFRCQPDLLLERAAQAGRPAAPAGLVPAFTATQYGHPGYAQLAPDCAAELRTGAEDGSEMGAFSRLRQPQREANLRTRLDEYLPFGLDAGLIYVT